MDANDTEKPDYYLLIDAYLEGWLDDAAMAEVDYRLEIDEEFRKQVATFLALREQAEEVQHDEASQKAVLAMLQTVAAERKHVSRLRHIRWEIPYKWLAAALVAIVLGVAFVIYRLSGIPSKPPIARNPSPNTQTDSSRRIQENDDQLASGDDTIQKPKNRQETRPIELIATRPLKVSVDEETDDSFGLDPNEVAETTLTAQLYRVAGRAEYELRNDTLRLYLPERMLLKKPQLSISQQADSTFKLSINKKTFSLQRKGRQPLR